MKQFLTLLLVGLSTVAGLAQTTNNVAISINDDTKTLTIDVSGEQNGKPLQYSRRFDVAALNDSTREDLKTRVLDSLGIANVAAPIPPSVPLPPGTLLNAVEGADKPIPVTVRCEACRGTMRLELAGNGYATARTWNNPATPAFPLTLTLKPGDYRYQYWQNGVLQMQLPFSVRPGQTNTVAVKW